MDTFVRQYLDTAAWADQPEEFSKPGEFDDSDKGWEWSPEALDRAERDCRLFLVMAGERLGEHPDPTMGAHDFWLTRNGHGAGFWDGDWPKHGDALSAISDAFGECDLYFGDDGLGYFL